MKRAKWFAAAAVVGTLFFGCKAKEQTAEAPPPEQPKAEAPAQPKAEAPAPAPAQPAATASAPSAAPRSDRKSTRLNSSHSQISYAVFCLKKKTILASLLVRMVVFLP